MCDIIYNLGKKTQKVASPYEEYKYITITKNWLLLKPFCIFSVAMVIVLFSLQKLVYYNLIDSATRFAVAQIQYTTVTRPLL